MERLGSEKEKMKTKQLTKKEAMEYMKRQLNYFERDIINKQFSKSLSFGINRMEYPDFMNLKCADRVLEFKTVTKYMDEQISKILNCLNSSKTKSKNCWQLKWGSGVEIFWYESVKE